MTIQLSSINKGDRARTNYGNIEALADSIEEIGLIQPIVLHRGDNDLYTLIAGGRRLAALETLGVLELHEGASCDPNRHGFVFQENLTPSQRLEIELEENMQRMNMSWTEELLLIAKVHAAKQREANLSGGKTSWGIRQTGALLNQSFGKVQRALVVAELLRSQDPEIMKCESLGDCIKLLEKRDADAAAAELAKRAGMGGKANDALLASLGLDSKPAVLQTGSNSDQVPVAPICEVAAPRTIVLANHLFLGDSVNDIMPRMPDSCVDHIVTDIPYGIDMENLQGMKNIERVENQHDVSQNIGLMPLFLKQAYRLIRDRGFCVFWYDLDHHEKLQTWAKDAGFSVQRWPLVWIKKHRCKNEAAGYNYTKTEEYAMVLRKGNATLVTPQPLSRVEADGSIERKLYQNPFAKPLAVWKFIYDAIAIRGQTVLDPFAGEMSASRAAVICGLTPFAIELESTHYNAGIDHVKNAYQLLTDNQVTFE